MCLLLLLSDRLIKLCPPPTTLRPHTEQPATATVAEKYLTNYIVRKYNNIAQRVLPYFRHTTIHSKTVDDIRILTRHPHRWP